MSEHADTGGLAPEPGVVPDGLPPVVPDGLPPESPDVLNAMSRPKTRMASYHELYHEPDDCAPPRQQDGRLTVGAATCPPDSCWTCDTRRELHERYGPLIDTPTSTEETSGADADPGS